MRIEIVLFDTSFLLEIQLDQVNTVDVYILLIT